MLAVTVMSVLQFECWNKTWSWTDSTKCRMVQRRYAPVRGAEPLSGGSDDDDDDHHADRVGSCSIVRACVRVFVVCVVRMGRQRTDARSACGCRVNFLKYKKPEKDLSNLDRSETFRIIHHIEREPRHGIPVRAPMVLCEEDVRNVSDRD